MSVKRLKRGGFGQRAPDVLCELKAVQSGGEDSNVFFIRFEEALKAN